MLFTSSTFLFAFLPVLLAVYYVIPHRFRNSILLVASLLFYSWGQPSGLLLLPLSIGVNYFVGRAIDRAHERGRSARLAAPVRHRASTSLFLGIAKYTFFALDNLNWALGSLGLAEIGLRPFGLLLGISFFTFHAISYLVDIYWRRASAQRNIVNYGLYIALFPQLIAGPIIRYRDIAEQLTARRVTTADLTEGTRHLHRRPREEAPARQRPRRVRGSGFFRGRAPPVRVRGVARRRLLRRPDLLRFLRVLGHGERAVPAVRVSHHQQLRLSLHLRSRCRSSGGAGTSRCRTGFATISTFRSAETGSGRAGRPSICSSCSCCAASGTARSGISSSGVCTTGVFLILERLDARQERASRDGTRFFATRTCCSSSRWAGCCSGPTASSRRANYYGAMFRWTSRRGSRHARRLARARRRAVRGGRRRDTGRAIGAPALAGAGAIEQRAPRVL